MMKLHSFLLIGLCAISGCSARVQTIVLPTTPLTDEQNAAVAREDAEACNCGCGMDGDEITLNSD